MSDEDLSHAAMLSFGTDSSVGAWENAPRAVDKPTQQPRVQSSVRGTRAHYRQLGSQISRFHVACEIGTPVRIGYIQA